MRNRLLINILKDDLTTQHDGSLHEERIETTEQSKEKSLQDKTHLSSHLIVQ